MWIRWLKRYGEAPFCFAMFNKEKQRRSCSHKRQFVCQSSRRLAGQKSLSLEYKTEEMFFSFFTVTYHYKATDHNMIDSWKERRMTGFNLTWYILDPTNKTTPKVISSTQAWRPVRFAPFFRNDDLASLVRMVTLALETRKENMTWDQVTRNIVKEKYEKRSRWC